MSGKTIYQIFQESVQDSCDIEVKVGKYTYKGVVNSLSPIKDNEALPKNPSDFAFENKTRINIDMDVKAIEEKK